MSGLIGMELGSIRLIMEQAELSGDTENLYYFYVDILVGSHHSVQSLIVDTGSHLTGFPCEPFCHSCGSHLHPHFN